MELLVEEKPEKDPLDELKALFEEAAVKAREAWQSARERSEAARQQSEVYRELATLGSAALDALERAIRKTWGSGGSR